MTAVLLLQSSICLSSPLHTVTVSSVWHSPPWTEHNLTISSMPGPVISLGEPGFTFLIHPNSTALHSSNERALLCCSLWWQTGITTPQDLLRTWCRATPPRSQPNGFSFNKDPWLWGQTDLTLNPVPPRTRRMILGKLLSLPALLSHLSDVNTNTLSLNLHEDESRGF